MQYPHRSGRSRPRQESKRNKYERWLDRQADSGNYFAYFRPFNWIMSISAAVLVQSLINLGKKKSRDGWIQCTSSFIEEQLNLTRREQDTLIAELRQSKFIKTERRGSPPKRWIRVSLASIHEALDLVQLHNHGAIECTPDANNKDKSIPNGILPKQSSLTRRRRLENKPMLINVEARTKTTPRYLPEDMISAAHLHDTVVHAGKRQAWSQVAWAKQFAALRDEVGFDRIELALDWIRKNIKKEYCPQAWSGKSFRAKFDQIEAAMNRDAERNPKVTISKDAKIIAAELADRWSLPGNCEIELPAAIQVSLDRYEKFWQALKSIRKKTLISNDVMRPRFSNAAGTLANEIRAKLSIPTIFVEDWFEEIAPWAIKKKVGTLFPGLVFSVENQRFQKMLRTIAADYGDSDGLVDLLKEIDTDEDRKA